MSINLNTPIEKLNKINQGTMMEQLHIEYLEVKDGLVKGRMPVNERTKQQMGILHGGANLALAETVGGLGSVVIVDMEKFDVRGAQISGNHLGTASSGWVYAEANLLHRGKYTHIWNIDIRDEKGKLISTCRLTNFLVRKK